MRDLFVIHGVPEYIRSDNGPEFISQSLRSFLDVIDVGTSYIEPGSPWQNGFVESFHSRFRDGHMESYAYSDIREVHCRDAGSVQVLLHSMGKKCITFEGRHLKELANLFCIASLRSVHEADVRDSGCPESSPEVTQIVVEPLETDG